ncbi:hypothetical protein [Pseudoalteromonas sp.]|uniref:hypothetical protein n=1 Tax=Pseudoalteromonas sp. TaxID=53249 RepID=UPI00257E562F|nr:hypothetical protein [Pseudoalteromonas sp.]
MFRYISTQDLLTLVDSIRSIILKNDHKINHLMLNKENPDFEGLWSIVEPDVYANKQLNYRGVKVLFYKMMVFLLEDIQEDTFGYSDYDDQPCNENPERFDALSPQYRSWRILNTFKIDLDQRNFTRSNLYYAAAIFTAF